MIGPAFAAASALAQAASNVAGAAGARRSSNYAVLAVAAPSALVTAVLLTALDPGPLLGPGRVWALTAGVVGGGGLAMAYRAFALGAVGIAAPVIAASSTLVIAVSGMAREGLPSPVVTVGLLLCLASIALGSRLGARDTVPRLAGAPCGRESTRAAWLLSLGAGSSFGTFVVLMSVAGDAERSSWNLVAARLGVLVVALVLVLGASSVTARPGRPAVAAGVLAGVLDTSANAFLVLALAQTSLVVVGVVTALNPAFAALGGVLLLGDRLGLRQKVGVGLCVTGAALASL